MMREEIKMTTIYCKLKLSLTLLQLLRLAHSKVADVPIGIHRSEGIPHPAVSAADVLRGTGANRGRTEQ
jgi:hypothetical protein